jgi:hypothetical protein
VPRVTCVLGNYFKELFIRSIVLASLLGHHFFENVGIRVPIRNIKDFNPK